ncbi:MAG: hypothetical protein IID41_06875 [Planctomycetes bacterium]|nr:hypothetical protein [Planctomycetota bacterium]MCH8852364.1 hypothetical protein [Planctomycetota bacterium]
MWFKSSFTTPAVLAISFCLIGPTFPAAADILHVPGDFPTIQEAIDAAMDGDEVEVHPGTYNENINLLGKAITVRSSDGAGVTTIDAGGSGTVVTCDSREGADTILDGFTITGGDASGGGGMRNSGSSPTVTNCTFSGNSAGDLGAGMYNFISNPTVTNCIFSGNSAGSGGGGILNLLSSNPTVTNCIFSGNSVGTVGGGMLNLIDSNPTVTNCVVWANSPDQMNGTASVSYSNVQGGWPGAGNIDADPLFVDAPRGDLNLSPGSPCIDAGDNTAVPEGIDTDLDGNDRFVDDLCTDDTGNGKPPIVDMGAYEFQLFQVTCPWDLDCNGSVGVKDLLFLLGAWGPCPPKEFCPADFDNTGDVGVNDLLILLGAWGPCP